MKHSIIDALYGISIKLLLLLLLSSKLDFEIQEPKKQLVNVQKSGKFYLWTTLSKIKPKVIYNYAIANETIRWE